MKVFYSIIAVICVILIIGLFISHYCTMMWGKVVIAFAAAFLVSALLKLFGKNKG